MRAFDPKALGARAQAMIDALAEISAEPDRLTRLFLTPAHRRAADLVAEWMAKAALEVRLDAAATVHGLLPAKGWAIADGPERDGHLSPVGRGRSPGDQPGERVRGPQASPETVIPPHPEPSLRSAPTSPHRGEVTEPYADGPRAKELAPPAGKLLLVGSHIDTVIDGGRYDGALGVVAGIMAVEEIRARSIVLPFELEILAFGDEEGARFAKTLMSSSAIAGCLDPNILDIVDADGVSIRDALTAFGGDPDGLAAEAYRPAEVLGYLELHIEQGPVLEQAGEALGVLSAIAGQGRYRINAGGVAGHAGTVPMAVRQDALAAAAEAILAIEAVARKHQHASMVATVGGIRVEPGAANVIPGAAHFSLDIRAADDGARAAAIEEIRDHLNRIGTRRGVVFGVETVLEKPVVAAGARLKAAAARGVADVTGKLPRELMSGAGHDGQAMAHLTEIGMIFIRCRAGISHNPLEHVDVEDMGFAVEALIRTILELAREEVE